MHGEGVDRPIAGACPQARRELIPRDAGPQAGVDPAARLGCNDIPGLGLAPIGRTELRSAGVIRMHLHREILAGVEELEEERKRLQRGVPTE